MVQPTLQSLQLRSTAKVVERTLLRRKALTAMLSFVGLERDRFLTGELPATLEQRFLPGD
jgi:hypothetical protein